MSWRERVVVLGGSLAVLAVAYVVGMALWPEKTAELSVLVPTSFFAIGKFLPLWGISGKSNFDPYTLGLVIWIMDTFSVLIIVYGLEALYKLGPLKRLLNRVQTNASLVLAAYPRFRRGAVIGIILFVLFPIAGTGAIGASFIGVLLGMHRAVLIASVSIGGCLGGFLMAFVAVHFGNALRAFQAMQQDPTVKYALLAVLVGLMALAFMLVSRAYRRALAHAQEMYDEADEVEPNTELGQPAAETSGSPAGEA